MDFKDNVITKYASQISISFIFYMMKDSKYESFA